VIHCERDRGKIKRGCS